MRSADTLSGGFPDWEKSCWPQTEFVRSHFNLHRLSHPSCPRNSSYLIWDWDNPESNFICFASASSSLLLNTCLVVPDVLGKILETSIKANGCETSG
jgi:hypothetical protein